MKGISNTICPNSDDNHWGILTRTRIHSGQTYTAVILVLKTEQIYDVPVLLESQNIGAIMSSVDEAVASQIRNIENKYGKSMGAWIVLVGQSGKTKHNDIIALLKTEYNVSHGDANRIALIVREAEAGGAGKTASTAAADPVDAIYDGKKAALRPIHDMLMAVIARIGSDVELAPKKGYVSLRRKKQFAIIQPTTATRVDVGLILKEMPATERLESASGFNSMCTHRIRVSGIADVDDELVGWLKRAYDAAG
jgi:hypothetical protein